MEFAFSDRHTKILFFDLLIYLIWVKSVQWAEVLVSSRQEVNTFLTMSRAIMSFIRACLLNLKTFTYKT